MSRRLVVAAVLCSVIGAVGVVRASAHSYADPALTTVFDGIAPTSLPPGVSVDVRPSVVDELVVTNATSTPLEVLAVGGEPFLRVSARGVEANLASPDWYSTGTPEGGPVPPADVLRDKRNGKARWVRVSMGSTWSEFDARLHPPAEATPEMRAAGKDRILASWKIPLRYGDQPRSATGHIAFTPVRGGLTVAVTHSPVTATALQGELPGLFLRAPAGREVVVQGKDGLPFLRFAHGGVEANTAGASWRDDQRAKGRTVTARGWVKVATGQTYSWLDGRLRYPHDLPPRDVLGKRTVVASWRVPVTVDGRPSALEGTITWVPRAVALGELGRGRSMPGSRGLLFGVLGAVPLLLAAAVLFRVRRRRRGA